MLLHHLDPWEQIFAPYDLPAYRFVLEQIKTGDVVLDIGAGDLRLARQMADIAKKVYAIEISHHLLSQAAKQKPFPENLIPVCADACAWDFPKDVTAGVLLMRHCTHFQLYAEKLLECGTQRLITNARWRMDVEIIALNSARIAYNDLDLGWYACWCGSTGFKSGTADLLTAELANTVSEVFHCPNCSSQGGKPPVFHKSFPTFDSAVQN